MMTDYQKLNRLMADLDHAERSVRSERKSLCEAKERIRVLTEAADCVQKVSEAIQTRVHKQVAGVVTRCLAAVFDKPYQFDIRFVKRRGRTEADLVLLQDGLELTDPMNQAGGGVLDVASFALRLVALILTQPKKRRLLVMDEPYRHAKPPEVLAPRICALLETLSREMKVQIILIPSIDRYYQIGKVIDLSS